MNLNDCYNFEDFRKLAKKKLPAPIFHYIDGGADDEVTLNRNTNAFNDCDLVPNVLASVGEPDLSTTLFGRKIDMPLFLSPTAMQSLYTPEGDKASARAAEKFNTMYSMSTMASFSIEEVAKLFKSKIKYLPARKGERYASALSSMSLSNKVHKNFGRIQLRDYVENFLKKHQF